MKITKEEYIFWGIIGIVFLFLGTTLYILFQEQKKCNDTGGLFVKQFYSYVCITKL